MADSAAVVPALHPTVMAAAAVDIQAAGAVVGLRWRGTAAVADPIIMEATRRTPQDPEVATAR
jgi:hypothetical protein